VVVDGIAKTDDAGHESYKARTPQEMAQIESLVKSAIGYDKTRGDQVQVSNMPFARMDAGPIAPVAAPLLGMDSGQWFKIIEVAILSLTALLIGFFVARPLINRMFAPNAMQPMLAAPQPIAGQLAAPMTSVSADAGAMSALPAPKDSMIDIQRIEGQVRESSIRKVGEVVAAHPEEALAIVRTWLHQPV
jgi:flagellar M-ring protein FliF